MAQLRSGFTKSLAGILAIAAIASAGAGEKAFAVEGGTGAYLLGSRDIVAGIAPPPGFYVSEDIAYVTGGINGLNFGKAIATDVSVDVIINKLSATYVPAANVLGGRVGVNVALPIVSVKGDFDLVSPIVGFGLSDSEFGLSDLVVTPMWGYDSGNLHVNVSASLFLPTGKYDNATATLVPLDIDVLSIGKNRFAVDPTVSITYLNPANGIELTGALGVTFSAKNQATDYQTAPELHFEAALAQHLPNGFTLAATGYVYQQLGNDSGSGAENLQATLGADSLEARVFGVGPMIAYSTKVGDTGVSMKLKYVHEFGAKRRVESDVIFGNLSLAF